ncbi:MAG: DnaJ domain-containing protein [Deltaproteobacteria bacterium]|nr:DnaJ domain-containing protein [Deltaproteobacteria bacterium]MCL5791799.1 DnaJ domain-containing protein [Deltaproteobacteria bacterium]
MDTVPRLKKQAHSISGLNEQEKFIISLIDGRTALSGIAKVSGLGLSIVQKIVDKLIAIEMVEIQQKKVSQESMSNNSLKELLQLYEYADPYTILGVDRKAAGEKIRNAYYERTKMYHPDGMYAKSVNKEDKRVLSDIYKKIQEAYEVLKGTVSETAKKPEQFEPTVLKGTPENRTAPQALSPADDPYNQIKKNVQKAAEYYKIGIKAFLKDDYSTAYINLKFANAYNPYEKEYINKLKEAEHYMRLNRYKELVNNANMYIETNKPQEAVNALKNALELTDEKQSIYYKLASVLYDFNTGSLKDASSYCQKAITCEPKNPDYHLLLAKIYKKAGLLKSAIVEYEHTIEYGFINDEINVTIKQLKGMVK